MMSCDSSTKKWACDYCTYQNWPSSAKCTMCRAAKPPQLIVERSTGAMDTEICSTGDTNPGIVGGWSCSRCTFRNRLQDEKCIQCRSGRVTEHNLHEQLQPLRIDVIEREKEAVEQKHVSPSLSPTPVSSSTLRGNDNHKWSCPTCTYENWPRSTKCVMCSTQRVGGARGRSQSPMEEVGAAARNASPVYERNADDGQNLPANATCATEPTNNYEIEQRMKMRRRADWQWLHACIGVVDGDGQPVEAYLTSGGDPARQLTASEVSLLNRSSAFDIGHTLVHLAIRFHREDILATLLSQMDGGRSGSGGVKRVPSYVAPDLAGDIRRHLSTSLRQRKGPFPCYFTTDIATFSLPAEIEELQSDLQEQLYDELLDRDVQKELEVENPIINWSLEIVERLGSRLYALWNRSAGDCLLDSVLQSTWGVFDRDNALRRALANSLRDAGHMFYARWKEYESLQASLLDFSLEESQWEEDWTSLLALANQPGASLEQLHVFTLAHILRRPVIIYGVKYVKSYKGEALGYARFEGVYLPLLWEQSFCCRSPVALGYTRGHFSALIPMEPYTVSTANNAIVGAHANRTDVDELQMTFLPLMTHDAKLLPVHFLNQSEIGREEVILRQWLDVCVTEGGVLVAQQRLHKRPLLVAQLVEEWLNHYRRLAQITSAPYLRTAPAACSSSDSESDDD